MPTALVSEFHPQQNFGTPDISKQDSLYTFFSDRFGHQPMLNARAPGRVNLLGEHVDYNDGPVLPAAIDLAVYLAVSPQAGSRVSLVAHDLGESVEFDLAQIESQLDIYGNPLPHWAFYPAGVAWALHESGFCASGLQAVFTSDIPIGSGLSSSAALEVGFAVTWQALGEWKIPPLELARICLRAENQYVGLACGLMDQFASACGVAGHALYLDTRSLEWHKVPLPDDLAIVIADSGVRRSLTHSGYNDRRAACEQAVAELSRYIPGFHSLRDITPTEFAAYAPFLSEIPRRRAEHVVKEISRVHSMVSAMQRNDKQAMGALMYAGHNSLRNLYQVSTPELDCLVELTRKLPGCIGARLTGAGFGGCTVNLVEKISAAEFIEGLKQGYFEALGREAQVYLCIASPGAQAALTNSPGRT